MNRTQAYALVRQTLTQAFDKNCFASLSRELVNHLDESTAQRWNNQYVKDAFKPHVQRYERLGTYTSPAKETLDVLIVELTTDSKLERARTAIRNFVADHLKTRDEKDAALVAFVSPSESAWRFSYIKMEYATVEKDSGKIGVEARLTPARRFSYIVGADESCHTAQSRFLGLLQDTATDPRLADIEEAFSVETVTKEFFTKYVELFTAIHTALDKLAAKDKTVRDEFLARGVNTVDFAKKLMGQIVFLYFLQKKGWLGVAKGADWGSGPRNFLRRLANREHGLYTNFFNDILEPLFYDELATDRGHAAWSQRFHCRIPFLNGGLFEPLGDYDWRKTDIILPDKLFTNKEFVEESITGTGVLDVFDRYNFTVNEAEPLEKEVAIDPEMLGKVFENLIEDNRRKGLGAYYTPREIVHYMCEESLINYLDSALNKTEVVTKAAAVSVPRADIETFVHLGEQISHYESVDRQYRIKMPKSIEPNARALDEALAAITVCDPAVGSGAFPVGMMSEIVRARSALTPYFNAVGERTPYAFKRHAIQNCLYGVDIDAGAVEIAKLRLWLSLVVDEEDPKQIKPLPNLDYKIVAGNSLIELITVGYLAADSDPVRSTLLKQLRSAQGELFNLTSPSHKELKRQEIDGFLQALFNNHRDRQVRKLVDQLRGIKGTVQMEGLGNAQFKTTQHKKAQVLDAQLAAVQNLQLPDKTEHFEWRIYFSEVFREKGGFDVVIANPPYISHDKIKDTVAIKSAYDAFEPFADAYCYFIEGGVKQLNASGILSFITSNSYLRADYGSPLRKWLRQTTSLLQIINIAGSQIFESAIVNVSILIGTKARNDNVMCQVVNSPFHGDTSFRSLVRAARYECPQSAFDTKSWTLAPMELIAVQRKIERHGKTLEKLNTKIRLGLATGHNKAFLIDEKKRNEFLRKNPANAKLIKPILRGRDIERYSYQFGGLYILLTRNGVDVKRDFPDIYSYLDSFGKEFKSRGAQGQRWTNLRACSFFDDFKKEKIIWIELSNTGRFALCTEEIYLLNSAYFLLPPSGFSAKYLLGVLNSRPIQFYLNQIAATSGMGVTFWINNYVKEFPIPDLPLEQQIPICSLVDRIMTAKRHDPKTDATALGREIDQLVYKLYKLTPEEISLVEGAVRGK